MSTTLLLDVRRPAFCYFPCGDSAHLVIQDNHRLSGAASIGDESVYRGSALYERPSFSQSGEQRKRELRLESFNANAYRAWTFAMGRSSEFSNPRIRLRSERGVTSARHGSTRVVPRLRAIDRHEAVRPAHAPHPRVIRG